MKKYNNKLVLDYIEGNDIEGHTIEELENDTDFMIQVIETTKDKNIYHLCSDKVKNDYTFIRYMVTTFKEDIPFVCMLADSFLDKNEGNRELEDQLDLECGELNILMSKITANDMTTSMKYSGASFIFYLKIQTAIASIKAKHKDINMEFGFSILEKLYNSSIILDYMANQYIMQIFGEDNNYSFEEFIHHLAKTKNRIDPHQRNSFLISIISNYDKNLSWYVSCHPYLLDEINRELEKVYQTWDDYERNQNYEKFDWFEEKLLDYFMKNEGSIPSFDCDELMIYIIKELHLEDKLKEVQKYYPDSTFIRFDEERFNSIKTLPFDRNNIIDHQFYEYGLALAKKIFMEEGLAEDCEDYLEEYSGKKAKIIQFSPNE